VIRGFVAPVAGVGSVDFIQQTRDTILRREPGRPLVYTELSDDIRHRPGRLPPGRARRDPAHMPIGSLPVDGRRRGQRRRPDHQGQSHGRRLHRRVHLQPEQLRARADWRDASDRPLGRRHTPPESQNPDADSNGIALRGDKQAAVPRVVRRARRQRLLGGAIRAAKPPRVCGWRASQKRPPLCLRGLHLEKPLTARRQGRRRRPQPAHRPPAQP
jgi:hypothetical protein